MEKKNDKPKLAKRLLGSAPKPLEETHKELRFTRARQGSFFMLLSAFCVGLGLATAIAMFSKWGPYDPDYQSFIWFCLIPLVPAFVLLRLALHCIRHAYLILTPMGIEIFPFWKPEKNLQVLFWQEIDSAECDSTKLTLHRDAAQTSGIVISLKPIGKQQISLLQKAISARTSSK
ncbi:hypothetical protein ACFPK9_15210 [Rubritalea spongiae]|uniref:DUF304 domain-containing protein n=1 Tax=Rubritalea spongiae TaxID=430797 RepID=A0ABW5E134_9BACT